MSVLDMFDKIDDIIYKPIETICEWTKEPLRRWERQHQLEMTANDNNHEKLMTELAADIEASQKRLDAEIEADKKRLEQAISQRERESITADILERERAKAEIEESQKRLEQELSQRERESIMADTLAKAKLDVDIRKWHAEIDIMINENEDARRDKLVECLKRYQTELATVTKDIVVSFGMMSLELRERANKMVLECTETYRKIQDEAKKQSMIELKEAKDEWFEIDKETFDMLRSNILEERKSAVEMAGNFIKELSEDIKRLNQNTDILVTMGMENTNRYLSPMANRLGVALNSPDDTRKSIDLLRK